MRRLTTRQFSQFIADSAQTGDAGKYALVAELRPEVRKAIRLRSQQVLLPGTVANHVWHRHGPNAKRPAWERMKISDWLEVQRIVDTVAPRRKPDGRRLFIAKPYKKSGAGRTKKKVGFVLVLDEDRNMPGQTIVVTFYRIDQGGYKNALDKALKNK